MRLYSIRHKPSGKFMPQMRGGRGYSSLSVEDFVLIDVIKKPTKKHTLPRLFSTKLGATRALKAWLMGEWTVHTTHGDSIFGGDDFEQYTCPPTKAPEDRKSDEMEIVIFSLKEKK